MAILMVRLTAVVLALLEVAVGKRLLPKVPFILGGKFTVDNLYLLDSITGMKLRGDLARQIKNSPDGTKVTFKIVV